MKKTLLAFAVIASSCASINADINVTLPENSGITKIDYTCVPVAKYAVAKTQEEMGLVKDSVVVKDNKATIAIPDDKGGYMYYILPKPRVGIQVYAYPGENITVNIKSIEPFEYECFGSETMDAQNEVDALLKPIYDKQKALYANGKPADEDVQALYAEYISTIKDFIAENPTSPAVVFAVMNLDGEDYMNAVDRLSERAKTSIAYPLVMKRYEQTKQGVEKERAREALAAGTTPAPDFTLDNTEGKPVSLSEFKGKWVVLDFWGSWCGWCIKGFPELKEAYSKYKDRLEIIGLDCNEGKEEWLAGVKKYELPWVNLYVPKGNKLLTDFGITGFPTKAIVDPKGIIRNITVGHNPEFFVTLEKLMAE